MIEPAHRFLHGGGRKPARDGAAGLRSGDQAGIRQHIEMLHDRRQRHRKRSGEITDGNVLVRVELREQRPPRRVGEGGKGAIERGLLILIHVVKCRVGDIRCQPARTGPIHPASG